MPKPRKTNKPVAAINRETGEVWTDFEIKLDANWIDEENLLFGARVTGKTIGKESFGWYKRIEETEQITESHPLFGEMVLMEDQRKFTKIYQLSEPQFEKDSFYRVWVRVERSLEMNTGVILRRTPQHRVLPIRTMADWQAFSGLSRSLTYQFVAASTAHHYIAPFGNPPERIWVANPQFCWNGYKIPTAIHDLFTLLSKTT